MRLKLSYSDTIIELPSEYSTGQRLELVEKIIETYPEEFGYDDQMFYTKYGKKQDINRLTKIKLDILGRYLIQGDENYTDNVMSRYKETKRPLQELSFSQIDIAIIEMNGFY